MRRSRYVSSDCPGASRAPPTAPLRHCDPRGGEGAKARRERPARHRPPARCRLHARLARAAQAIVADRSGCRRRVWPPWLGHRAGREVVQPPPRLRDRHPRPQLPVRDRRDDRPAAARQRELDRWRRDNRYRLSYRPDLEPPQAHLPNGRLRLSLPHYHVKRANWTENPRGPLEGKLASVFVELERRADEDDRRDAERRAREEEYRRAAEERAERERLGQTSRRASIGCARKSAAGGSPARLAST